MVCLVWGVRVWCMGYFLGMHAVMSATVLSGRPNSPSCRPEPIGRRFGKCSVWPHARVCRPMAIRHTASSCSRHPAPISFRRRRSCGQPQCIGDVVSTSSSFAWLVPTVTPRRARNRQCSAQEGPCACNAFLPTNPPPLTTTFISSILCPSKFQVHLNFLDNDGPPCGQHLFLACNRLRTHLAMH